MSQATREPLNRSTGTTPASTGYRLPRTTEQWDVLRYGRPRGQQEPPIRSRPLPIHPPDSHTADPHWAPGLDVSLDPPIPTVRAVENTPSEPPRQLGLPYWRCIMWMLMVSVLALLVLVWPIVQDEWLGTTADTPPTSPSYYLIDPEQLSGIHAALYNAESRSFADAAMEKIETVLRVAAVSNKRLHDVMDELLNTETLLCTDARALMLALDDAAFDVHQKTAQIFRLVDDDIYPALERATSIVTNNVKEHDSTLLYASLGITHIDSTAMGETLHSVQDGRAIQAQLEAATSNVAALRRLARAQNSWIDSFRSDLAPHRRTLDGGKDHTPCVDIPEHKSRKAIKKLRETTRSCQKSLWTMPASSTGE